MNRVCQILGIQRPVIQAPMAWITSPELVAAVSNAGGLGVLGTGAGSDEMTTTVEETTEAMRSAVRRTRALTDKPFGVNVFPADVDPYGFSAAIIDMLQEEGVKILVVAGSIATEEFMRWKQRGFTLIVREANPTVRGAQAAEKAGVDIIVATGCDEGGSMPRLSTGTTAATMLLAENVSIPVLAAGGIVNAKMALAAKVVGAEGVFVGTRFILSKECRAADATKADIMATHPDDFIVYTQRGGLARWRTTPHKVGREGLAANQRGDFNPPPGSFFEGMLRGNLDAGVNTVCNVASLIKSIDSCADIVAELAAPFAEA